MNAAALPQSANFARCPADPAGQRQPDGRLPVDLSGYAGQTAINGGLGLSGAVKSLGQRLRAFGLTLRKA